MIHNIDKFYSYIELTPYLTTYSLILSLSLIPLINIALNINYKWKAFISNNQEYWNKTKEGFSRGTLKTFILNKDILNVSLSTATITFVISLLLIITYKGEIEFKIPTFSKSNYDFVIGIDGISLSFIALNSLLLIIILFYNYSNYYNFFDTRNSVHTNIFLLLFVLLTNVFLVRNLFLFYLFFESILPILFILIAVYGSSERISAAYYLFLYTLVGSMFLLLGILLIYYVNNTFQYALINNVRLMSYNVQCIAYILIMIGICVKIPLFPVHIWLPLAHSESPVSGSVLLAGIVLKLAVYGFVEIVLNLLPEASLYLNQYITILSVVTLFYRSLVTIRNLDNKIIIAYSSIAHMAIIMIGLTSNTFIGLEGGILLSIAHGFISPALFILLGGIIYEKYHTRLIHYYRGVATYYPIFSILFFIAILGNMGIPLSLNFIGELFSIIGSLYNSLIICILASCTLLLASSYSIWLYSRITNGYYSYATVVETIKNKTQYNKMYVYIDKDLNKVQLYYILTLLYITVLLGIFPTPLIELLEDKLIEFIYI